MTKFVGYQGEYPVAVGDSREELESREYLAADRIEEVEQAEIINGWLYIDGVRQPRPKQPWE